MKNIQDVLHHELKDLYSAENQLAEVLPKMIKAADNKELIKAFQDHLKHTHSHIQELENICKSEGITLGREKCKGMEGLVKEVEHRIKEESSGPARDAALISAAQRIEHYEIAGYGSAKEFSRMLGNKQMRKSIDKILDQEAKCNEILNDIAVFTVNEKAKS